MLRVDFVLDVDSSSHDARSRLMLSVGSLNPDLRVDSVLGVDSSSQDARGRLYAQCRLIES